jgi:pimeloyl-ACP methyl ester carboxylesterase
LSQLDPGPVAAFFDRSHWEGFEAETMLKRISCPVLLIHGNPEKGAILTQEQVELIQSAIRDCVADYVDTWHAPHLDQPNRTIKIVTDFVESL